jgi:hypothetical protein
LNARRAQGADRGWSWLVSNLTMKALIVELSDAEIAVTLRRLWFSSLLINS